MAVYNLPTSEGVNFREEPHKILYNRFIRWGRLGVFNKSFAKLVEQNGSTTRLTIDVTHLKAHRLWQAC